MKEPDLLQMAIKCQEIKEDLSKDRTKEGLDKEQIAIKIASHLLEGMEQDPNYDSLHKSLRLMYQLGQLNAR